MDMEYREKLQRMTASFGNPFSETVWDKPQTIAEALDAFQEHKKISLAGRLISKREHGKSGFAHIMDHTGRIQLYAQKDKLGEGFDLFKDLDIGDIIGVCGELFTTRTKEKTILISEVRLLAKALRPLPEKWHGLKDVETRYRQRYLDLIANPHVRDVFLKRSKIIVRIREFFQNHGYIEVETPMLHQIAGGAAGKPFATHHNATDSDVYLRIAPELYLKRLLVGSIEKNFEINRSFRNEGISTRHNPEFTMLEAYCAYRDYEYMMTLCEELVSVLATEVCGGLQITYQARTIDLTPPWQRISFAELFKKEFGVELTDSQDVMISKVSKKLHLPQGLSRTQVLKLCEELIEKNFPGDKPVFITDFFTWTSPLAKQKKDNPHVVERFELFIAGLEVANAYSELNDPIEQKKRFAQQLEVEEELPKKIDEDFIVSLEHGMPPAAGLGVGIDRLVMVLLNQPSIRDVILFPLLKPLEHTGRQQVRDEE